MPIRIMIDLEESEDGKNMRLKAGVGLYETKSSTHMEVILAHRIVAIADLYTKNELELDKNQWKLMMRRTNELMSVTGGILRHTLLHRLFGRRFSKN